MELVSLIQTLIIDNDGESITDLLSSMRLDTLEQDTQDNFLVKLFSICTTYNKKNATASIYNYWRETLYSEDSGISFYSFLFLYKGINVDILKFIGESIDNIEQFGIASIISDLNDLGKDVQVAGIISAGMFQLACERAVAVYGIPSPDSLRSLYELTYDGNRALAFYFGGLLRVHGDFAEIPSHMVNINNEEIGEVDEKYDQYKGNPLPKESEVVVPNIIIEKVFPVSNADLVDIVLEGSNINIKSKTGEPLTEKEIKEATEELRQKLIKVFNELTVKGKLENIAGYLKAHEYERLRDSITLFMLLGPVSAVFDADVSEMQYGGERMLISNAFEYEDLDDDNIGEDEWYKGYCQFCNHRIRRKYHAVRRPLDYGGWVGCYCSWLCVRTDIETYSTTDIMSLRLVDKFEDEVNSIGITDRIPDDEYDEYLINYYKAKGYSGDLSIFYFYQINEGVVCEGCKEFESDKKIFEELCDVVDIDVDDTEIGIESLGINSVPAFVIYKGKDAVIVMNGYDKEKLLETLAILNKV